MKSVSLLKYYTIAFLRERGVIISLVILPLLLQVSAQAAAPKSDILMKFDGSTFTSSGVTLNLMLYSLTAVVIVASISSFFLAHNLRNTSARLKLQGYSSLSLIIGLLTLVILIDVFIVTVIYLYDVAIISVRSDIGFFVSLVSIAVIFSTIGIILASVSDSKSLGLYLILTLGVVDTAFIENPVLSRRYNDNWIDFMPSHGSVKMLFRSVYDTGTAWTESIYLIIIYEIGLLLVLWLYNRYRN